jgi:release factor glutamine methyltransferase
MADRAWTVLRVLGWTRERFAAAGIFTARLDAEVLLADALGVDRLRLYLDPERPLTQDELTRYRDRVRRRMGREPVAYITGAREFYSVTLAVDNRVLVPRPETELLVDLTLARLRDHPAPRIVDVGTGSGAIAIALAANLPRATVAAVDASDDALAVAAANVAAHGLGERVTVRRGDLLAGCGPGSFDAVVSNPPYVAEGDLATLMPEVRDHEPRAALVAGPDGLDAIRRLVPQAARALAAGGLLVFEIGGPRQSAEAARIVTDAGAFDGVAVHRDLAGLDRAVTAVRRSG